MGTPVMVFGQSGSGKSTSLRNFTPDEVCIINVSGKPLPFKNQHKTFNCDNYMEIDRAVKVAPTRAIIIDDATYLMTNEFMRGAKTSGYQKFTDMALNFWTLVQTAIQLPEDRVIYFLGHVDIDANGNEKFKTIGKLLDEKVTLEGLFTIVLKTVVTDGKYSFATQTNGADTVKSPVGMFQDRLIDNDLKAVDTAIREYWGIAPLNMKEDKK
ncbi:AAA family ATPase [Pseudoflavonifractor phocaeensis]|uniref:AAA family ATPase n=1 Tax=Pseudoflavonifractor phocaeensis TaxID=1870988 RepID=UPI00313C758F